ncbi:unnamed protein product [Dovyalis caffra]|uniref:Uncharacterized protein n=1 Tax=Dovyalis caffra TaxID=77055 RepID=A0AAV1RL24_9ROSI|nr:unnamed protein product [Dovyalis caffra]
MASSKCHQKPFNMTHSENHELKVEMAEISEQQESIKQGQKEMRERFEAIDSECNQLKKETEQISHASENVQLRLDIMLNILKAQQEIE